MAMQFTIDDAFVLEGDEEGAVSDGETEGWKGRDKDREGGEMTFGPLTFSKPQTHPSPAAPAGASLDHSNLKYQVHIQHITMPASIGLKVVYLKLQLLYHLLVL